MSELGKQLGLLAIVVVVIAAVLLFFGGAPSQPTPAPVASLNHSPTPPSAAVLQQLKDSPAFQISCFLHWQRIRAERAHGKKRPDRPLQQ